MYDITRPQVSTCEHTEPKYNNRVCIYNIVFSPLHYIPLSLEVQSVWRTYGCPSSTTGLHVGTTLGSDLSTVTGVEGGSSGLECRWHLFLLITPEGVCTSYDRFLLVCTIVPGGGFVPGLVVTNTGSSQIITLCLLSKLRFCVCLNCSSEIRNFCKSGHLGLSSLADVGTVERICLPH